MLPTHTIRPDAVGQRPQQLSGEREVAEHVRGEDDLVAVGGGLALLRRMHDARVQQQSVERARGRAIVAAAARTEPEVARVQQERLDAVAGIRNPPPHRRARGHQPVRAAAGHEHAGARAHELLAREVAEPARSSRSPGSCDRSGRGGAPGPTPAFAPRLRPYGGLPCVSARRALRSRGRVRLPRDPASRPPDRLGACGPAPTSNAG